MQTIENIPLHQCEAMTTRAMISDLCCEKSIELATKLVNQGKANDLDPRLAVCYTSCSRNKNKKALPPPAIDPDDPPTCKCGRGPRTVYTDGITGKRVVYIACIHCQREWYAKGKRK